MDDFVELMAESQKLKQLLDNLKNTTVTESQETIKQIQIEYLKNRLTIIGHKLIHINIYRKLE